MNKLTLHENIRSHNFDLLLYTDTTDYNIDDVLSIIVSCESYAYIKHDKDTLDDGSLKKEHYHVILHFSNCRTIKTISNLLGVPSNYINPITSLRGAIRYLIHRDYDTKFQYPLEDIIYSNSFNDKICSAFYNEKNERDILLTMKNYVDSCSSISMQEFFSWCIDNNFERVYKKYYYIFKDLILLKHD